MGVKRKYNKISPPEPVNETWLTNHAAASFLAYKKQVYSTFEDKVQLARNWRHHRTIYSNLGLKCNIYVDERTGGVLVAYRGTSTAKEGKIDLMIGKEKFFNNDGLLLGEVYRGFGNAFEEILPVLKNELEFLYSTTYMRKAPLEFTGHSLGGALSDLSATYFGYMYPTTKVVNTTFASPSVGDGNYVKHAKGLDNVFRTRVVCVGDPISNVKIPGTEFTENENVLQITSGPKGWKKSVLDLTKALGGIVPRIGIGAYEAKQAHSIDTIIDELQDSLKGTRFAPPEDIEENQDLNEAVDNYNQEYVASQQAATFDNLTDLSKPCQCECHQADLDFLKNGTPEEQIENHARALLGEQTVNGLGVTANSTNSYGQVLDQTQAESQLLGELNDQNANKLPDDILKSIEASLNNDLQKRKDKITKMEDEYQSLVKPIQADDEDLYSFTKKQENDLQQNVAAFDQRIQFEIDHPEQLGKDNPAIKLKEEFSQLYKNIQTATGEINSAKEGVAALDNTYLSKQFELNNVNLTDEQKQDLEAQDQAEQRNIAGQEQTLNATFQGSADFVLNYALIDPNNKDENVGTKPQLTEDQRKQVDAALQSQGVTLDQLVNGTLDAKRNADVLAALDKDTRLLVDEARVKDDIPKETFSEAQTQLREWLNYPEMTPQKLYDLLVQQRTAQYKQERTAQLAKDDNDLKTKAAQDLNEKINKLSDDQLVTDETTGKVTIKDGFKNLDAEMNRKREFMKKVYSNTEVQKIFETGRISTDAMFKNYTLDKTDDEQLTSTFKDLLGYDPAIIKQQNADKLEKDIFNITTSNKSDAEKYQLIQDAENLGRARDQYPWLDDNQLNALMSKYKDDPQLMAAVINQMSQQRWNNIAYEKSGDFRVDPKLATVINNLTYQTTQEGTYTDLGQGLTDAVYKSFSDPATIQQLFAEWNQGSNDNEAISTSRAATSALGGLAAGAAIGEAPGALIGLTLGLVGTVGEMQRMKNQKEAGWFDKFGNKLGNAAPRVFADWASKTGQYQYRPLKPVDPTIQKITDLVQGAETTFIGINSNEIGDLGATMAGKTNYVEQTGIIEDGHNPVHQTNMIQQEYINHLMLQNALGSKNIPGYMSFNRLINVK